MARSFRGEVPLPDDRISGLIEIGGVILEKDLDCDWMSGVGRQAALSDWIAGNRAWTGGFMLLIMM